MPLRPCLGSPARPDCTRLADGNRCDECKRSTEQARGTHTERGYDADYEAAKQDPAYRDATHCVTCSEPFTTDNPKTAGHAKAIRNGGTSADGIIPQCARCNYGWRRTGA